MIRILNEGPVMQPSTQQAVRNGAANAGLSAVVAVHVTQTGDNHIFDIYSVVDEENHSKSEYSFSIDTDGDVIFER